MLPPYQYQRPVRRRFQDRVWKHVVLFLLTLLTTTALAGASYYYSFATEFERQPLGMPLSRVLWHGLWYSVPVLLILGAHEMGHYVACRRYNVTLHVLQPNGDSMSTLALPLDGRVHATAAWLRLVEVPIRTSLLAAARRFEHYDAMVPVTASLPAGGHL